jgi:hypothetical protein
MREVPPMMTRACMCIQMILVLSLICFSAIADTEPPKDELNVVLSRFPSQHVLTLSELDLETRTFFLKHFPKGKPGIVRADFDGDGHEDFALLLRDNKSKAMKLQILLCSGEGQCKSAYDLDVAPYYDIVYLQPIAVGSTVSQTEAIDANGQSSPVKLKRVGIEITFFGKSKAVLYWNTKHKKIEEVQTAD